MTFPEPLPLPTLPSPPVFRFPLTGERIEYQGNVFIIGSEIGRGAFGRVFECVDEWRNDLAAKVVKPDTGATHLETLVTWRHELHNLVSFRHPNVTHIYDAFVYENAGYLIMERCFRPLQHVIGTPGIIGDLWLPHVARDVLQALEFLHHNNVVHKDLHAGNVFVSQVRDRMVPTKTPVYLFKIGDLGISRLETDMRIFGTMMAQWMLPPEYLSSSFGQLSRQVDIYHVGLLLLSLILNDTPHFTHEEILAGVPRQTAESLQSPYASAVAQALRRHVDARFQSPLDFWRAILGATRENAREI